MERQIMSTESKVEWTNEWQYRYEERNAILSDGGNVTNEMREAAYEEANDAIKRLKWVAAKRRLTDAWCAAYARVKGFKYMFQGAKDGTAADRLLKLGLTVTEIMVVAEEAWKHPDWFNCKIAASLAGFASRFNEIREEQLHPPIQNGARLMLHRDEYNRILARMKTLKETYSGMQSWRQEDKDEFLKLRQRRNELRSILGMVV